MDITFCHSNYGVAKSRLEEGVGEALHVLVEFALDWDLVSADGAAHVTGEVPLGDVEGGAFYEWCVAVGANRVLAGVAGDVAEVDVVESLVSGGEVGLLHFLDAGRGRRC